MITKFRHRQRSQKNQARQIVQSTIQHTTIKTIPIHHHIHHRINGQVDIIMTTINGVEVTIIPQAMEIISMAVMEVLTNNKLFYFSSKFCKIFVTKDFIFIFKFMTEFKTEKIIKKDALNMTRK